MNGLVDFLQGASNAAASNVSGPVDLISWLLRKGGMGGVIGDAPVGSSAWMTQKGFTRPTQGAAGLLGEAAGLSAPIVATAKAPQIAAGFLQMGENAAAPRTLHAQRGVLDMGDSLMGKYEGPAYQIDHKPMTIEGGAAPLHDFAPVFGDDIYNDKNALQFFGSGDPREKSVMRILNSVRGKPDATVTIYRGVPDGVSKINPGDWVTLDPKVAADYGNVISMKVPASSITSWPDSLLEFGYYPK